MKIQTRITLLLIAVTLLFVAGLWAINTFDQRREELVLKSNIHAKNTLYDKVVRLEEASLFVFAYDYSNRDDVAAFAAGSGAAQTGDRLRQTLASFDVDALWVYNADLQLIYSSASGDGSRIEEHPAQDKAFRQALSFRYFWHFFMYTPRGLMEVRCAPIQPGGDTQRQTAPRGYLFAGRLWSEGYIQHLSDLTESKIMLQPISGRETFEPLYDQEQGFLLFSRIARSWDKKPLVKIQIQSPTPFARQLQRSSRLQLLLMCGFVTGTIALLSVLLILWVNVPLKKITRGLDAQDPGLLEELRTSKTEFGNLARLILWFFHQKEELADSEERFRSVVQTAGEAIITLNRQGRIVFWNRGAEKIFGYAAGEVTGNHAGILLPERFKSIYEQSLSRARAVRGPEPGQVPVEMVGLRKSGAEFPMELSQAFWQSKEDIFYTLIVRDIGQRKQAEEQLRKSEKRLRDIFEHSLTGQCILIDGRIVYQNQEQARLFGPLDDRYRFHDCTYVHPDDVLKVKTFYREVTSATFPVRNASFRFYPAGKMHSAAHMRWVTCRGTLIEYQGKRALFLNMMDITRFMELEQLLRMQDKMASLGRVAAGIAHEIRNPLTGINSYLFSLQNTAGGLPPETRERFYAIVSEIQTASNKIEAVIKRVMDFSRPTHPQLELMSMNRSIDAAVKLSAATLRKSGIRLTTDLELDLPACRADLHMMEQVLLNLVTNAAQALGGVQGQRQVEIVSRSSDDAVIIRVSDNGPGIPVTERDKIFDPFYTTKADGYGIGLSLCQRIVLDHGGTLTLTESQGGGAEFSIELPRPCEGPRPLAGAGSSASA